MMLLLYAVLYYSTITLANLDYFYYFTTYLYFPLSYPPCTTLRCIVL
jgi:hypothetical protein